MTFSSTLKSFITHAKTRFFLKLIIPVAILTYLFLTLDLSEILTHLRHINSVIFFVSFLILCLKNVFGALRSSILLKYKNLHYSTGDLTKFYFIGNFFNLFLPEIIGRDIARGYYLYNTSNGKKESISSIVVERFIGTVALLLLSVISILLAVYLDIDVIKYDVVKVIVITFVISCFVVTLFFFEETEQYLDRLMQGLTLSKLHAVIVFIRDVITYNKSPLILWYTFVISLWYQFIGVLSTYLIALSLGSKTSFVYFLILLPVIWVIGMLPVSINGLGVREGSFVFLFGTVGMASEMSMAICILWFVQNIGLGIIGGVLFAFEGSSISRNKSSQKGIEGD